MQDLAGVRVAAEVGADRVELATALALGGLTPSPATIELAVETVGTNGPEVHVLIRPRAGGFHYTEDELAITERDVRRAVGAGAAGVVVGAVDAEGCLDLFAMARLRDAADGAPVTLHRAIDVTANPVATLVSARDLGLCRVLTSGAASKAIDGIDTIRALVTAAEGQIQIMAGSGVDVASAPLLAAVGVDAIHYSAKRAVIQSNGVRMGSASDGVGGYEVTDRDIALAIRDAVAR